ncbi:hypothetical protein GQ53DRAFT_828203 [Thozetella sp. PMI_491]|nr:hypothetical protein GQ53DRAFT_828203 [Thozetella sp. PMI_491]
MYAPNYISLLVAVSTIGGALAAAVQHAARSVDLEPRGVTFHPLGSASAAQSLSKRLTFTSGGRDDYCGEANPTFTYGDDTPVAADCAAISSAVAAISPGFWTVDVSDFHPPNGWATIASSGTCQFALQFQVPSQTQSMFFGTNDLRFYINSYVGNSQNGHIQAIAGVACNNNTGGVLLIVNWGMIHS